MDTVYIDQVPFKHNSSEAALVEVEHRMANGRTLRREGRAELSAALAAKSWLGIHDARQQLLGHKDIKLEALIRANKQISPQHRWSIERCVSAADTLTLYAPDNEPVRLWLKPKAKGYRVIQAFGARKKAAQLMVMPIMDTYFNPRPYQHTLRGYHSAIKAAKTKIKAGLTHFIHLDIENHFGSFTLAELSHALPLPQEVVEHAVLSKDGNLVWDTSYAKAHKGLPALPQYVPGIESALSGLPQGSACAPIIAAYCVARAPWQESAGVETVNYADNFCLFAENSQVLAVAAEELKATFAKAPGGSFSLVVKDAGTVAQGLDFLGHRLRLSDGQLKTEPLDSAYGALCSELEALDDRLNKIAFKPGGKHVKVAAGALWFLARYVRLLQGWKAAYHECDDLEGWFAVFEDAAATWMKAVGVSEAEVKAAITPDMKAEPELY